MGFSIVILAAGNGKRMMSALPKVLQPLGGQPLLLHVIQTAKSLNPDNIYVVQGTGEKQVAGFFPEQDIHWIEQVEQKGTGHALYQVMPHINCDDQVLVLYGDVPLIRAQTLKQLLVNTNYGQLGILVARIDQPNGFGRIIRTKVGSISAIVEHRDATRAQRQINEINTGILVTTAKSLQKWLPQLKNENAQGEFYLTDIVSLAVKDGVTIVSTEAKCQYEIKGVNDRKELIILERHYQTQLAHTFLAQGVTIIDPARFDCRGQASLAPDVLIDINVILEGTIKIGEGSYIGPNTILKNVTIGKNVKIKSNCVIEDASIADDCELGPFSRIRPKTTLAQGVHVGNFVELKNTQIADNSKVNHLTYLGDAVVGKNVNVGAGTITCNYDGEHKYTTVIEDGAFIGSGTELVAPITIGEEAYIGAGSTITKDAPERQLSIARAKQVTIVNWKPKKKET